MKFLPFGILLVLITVHRAGARPIHRSDACRFAPMFTTQELLLSNSSRDLFIRTVMYWEGQFHQPGIGYNAVTGMTYDGHGLNYTSGDIDTSNLHFWSAPSKEGLHFMMLALSLSGNEYARIFVSSSNVSAADEVALDLLERKMGSMEAFDSQWPGFGGFLPWFFNYDAGLVPANDWYNSVPSLDNGEMIWGIYAARVVLASRSDTRSQRLALRLNARLQLLATTAPVIFYDGGGRIRSVATIANNKGSPMNSSNYALACTYQPCFLDDPYEGEMFAFFLDMYSTWSNQTERDSVWVNKRTKLQSVNFTVSSSTINANISVQRGWWFSAHEQWKYLELPYLDVPINARVFRNGERARSWNSALKRIPGMYASVTDVCAAGQQPPDYISSTGIESISFNSVDRADVVTPYGSFPVMLADLPTGLTWYNLMLQGPSMQGLHGSTEAVNVNGTDISPVVTWDSKITSAVAMLGGVADIVAKGLKSDGVYDRFTSVVQREWSLAFPSLVGEDLAFATPQAAIPTTLGDFSECRLPSLFVR